MTGNLLAEIVSRKRSDVAARFAGTSLAGLRERARLTRRSLGAALGQPGMRFVMEVKKASPTAGAIRAGVDVESQARAYRGAAAAISILTDGPFFGGSLEDLAAARRAFEGPLLAKDFFVDLRQVAEARIAGADAILVMLSVLDDEEARAMLAEAARFGMEAIVEVHEEEELARALALGARSAPILGINNRNLKTLAVDLAVTERLALRVPADRLLIAESGISGRADADRLVGLVDACLVGTALMRDADPALAVRALAHGRVKVCGLRREEDVVAAAQAGAAFAGLIHVPGTPRALTRDAAHRLAEVAREAAIRPVGVFRNAPVAVVARRAAELGLAAVQLHGEEDAGYLRALRALVPAAIEIWSVATVGAEIAAASPHADRTLFDTVVGGRSGGTGRAFAWPRLAGRDDLSWSLLAGGIGPANAAAAARVGAWGLDVGSALEHTPGIKDPARIAALFDALRPAGRLLQPEAACA